MTATDAAVAQSGASVTICCACSRCLAVQLSGGSTPSAALKAASAPAPAIAAATAAATA